VKWDLLFYMVNGVDGNEALELDEDITNV